MSSENPVPALAMPSKEVYSLEQPAHDPDREDGIGPVGASAPQRPSRLARFATKFEQRLVEYNLEARGIERVREDERLKKLTWVSYLQAFLLWVSINLAANNITLGMLGPAVYGLSFLDAALCGVFGAFVGALVASWMATWGPISGIRTMVCGSRILTRLWLQYSDRDRYLDDTQWAGGRAKWLLF